ncbi:MAG: hypothetical protein WCR53_02480 [Bacteroidaceae bacterium]|nr:hypothetical protein [Bacteroidaceae bacterium]
MKTKFHIITFIFMLCFCMQLTSCDDGDNWDENVLTGKWWSIDDSYDLICIDFYSNHSGLCTEDSYYHGISQDRFTWFVDKHLINIIFNDGSRWIWDYDLYNGHTVKINGRLFSRDRYYDYGYYSKKFKINPAFQTDTINK